MAGATDVVVLAAGLAIVAVVAVFVPDDEPLQPAVRMITTPTSVPATNLLFTIPPVQVEVSESTSYTSPS